MEISTQIFFKSLSGVTLLNIVGMDIGYSNLKVAFGENEAGTPITVLRPAGAAPADRFGHRMDGKAHDDFINVLVNGKEFVAGVSPDRAQIWNRSLHEDYPSTESYMALFKAGLLLTGVRQIDALVTGLPVSQFLDDRKKKSLERKMQGSHLIAPGVTVEVSTVKVVPQPIGGFIDFLMNTNEDIEDANLLIVDPGFFSVDWVVVNNNVIRDHSSGTSLNACSVLLEEVARQISQKFETKINVESIENAIRNDKSSVMVMGQRIELAPFLKSAREKIGPAVSEMVQQAVRNETKDVDLVVLVGGGANLYFDVIKQAFPRQKVLVSRDSVFSNCRGFWAYGMSKQ